MTGTDADSRKALVLYGSETGNAHDAAEELGRLVRRLHFAVVVCALDEVSLDELQANALILVAISTTGQGDLPRNAQSLWKKLLRRRLPPTLLSKVPYAVFGLGDSSYPNYNFAALKLSKRFSQLGAQELLALGEADEQHPEGNDATFIPWAKDLEARLLDHFPLNELQEVIPESVLLQPPWLLSVISKPSPAAPSTSNALPPPSGNEVKHLTRLSIELERNERLTPPDHWQDVRHLVFSSQSKCFYNPGDVLEIQPQNSTEDVQQVLEMMGWIEMADVKVGFSWNPDYNMAPLTSSPSLQPTRSGMAMSLSDVLTTCVDLNAIPKRSFFRLVAHFTNDEFHKTRLEEFADPQYTDELFDYTTRPRRSVVEVLQEFDTVKIPWEWVFEVFSPLRGRQFSIASGGDLKQDGANFARFELLVAIVKYKTVIRKVRRGVCTRYLEGLDPGAVLEVSLIPGSMGIDKRSMKVPLVLIGPGTGVAPLRALLWEKRTWQRSMRSFPEQNEPVSPKSGRLGTNLLLFGCRNQQCDFFFREEWQELQREQSLDMDVAFSRDQASKVYVQDLLRKRQSQVFDMLYHGNGFVCVCGASGKMPQAVRAALTDIFEAEMACDRSTAEAYLRSMEKTGRYKQETW